MKLMIPVIYNILSKNKDSSFVDNFNDRQRIIKWIIFQVKLMIP